MCPKETGPCIRPSPSDVPRTGERGKQACWTRAKSPTRSYFHALVDRSTMRWRSCMTAIRGWCIRSGSRSFETAARRRR
jgi:hypothetical protein